MRIESLAATNPTAKTPSARTNLAQTVRVLHRFGSARPEKEASRWSVA